MSLEALRDQIASTGAGNAIVRLDPQRSLVDQGSHAVAGGTVRRQAGTVNPVVLAELASSFNQGSQMLHFPHLGIVYGAVNFHSLAALEAHHAVDDISHAAELSLIRPHGAAEVIHAPGAEISWGIKQMRAPELWAKGVTGKDVLIVHLDTGVESVHPTLEGAIARTMVFGGEGHEMPPQLPYLDSGDHGTHTAGVLAGRNNTGGPIVGMAPDSKLACGTVIEDGDTVARVLAGMNWALAEGARVLNLSVGFPGQNDSFVQLLRILRAQQLLPVIAIGNDGPQKTYSPGNSPDALSVGASYETGEVAPFSGSQAPGGKATGPRLCAPGIRILSAWPNNSYTTQSGTSMATPHVAGLAALLFEARPAATIDDVENAIVASCKNPANVDRLRIGAGIPDGLAALEKLNEILM